MRGPHNIFRLIRTGATFERTGAMGAVLEAMEAPRSLRIAARVLGWPFKWLGLKGDPNLPPITRAITALGPSYIKFGQILSTRPDFVGHELAQQLRYLQDKLPPFETETAKRLIEEAFGKPVDALFTSFSDPVAAASIAQVHHATLAQTGQDVAVKVIRPGIGRAFSRDIDAFYFAAWFIEKLAPGAKRLRPRDVIAHFEETVLRELDMRIETAASAEFRANTENDPGFQVPAVVWSLSQRNVMVLDWAQGIGLNDLDAIDAAGHDRTALGNRVLELFLQHALRDGYFHGDMHQGNLKVAPNGDLVALDFGIMGRLDAYTRRVYAEILIGFIRKDYKRVAEVHFEAGYVPKDRDVHDFAQALRSVGEPIFGMEANQISMGRLLTRLFEVTETFGMETRTELLLLQRTMVVVEGVARSLNPNVNIWEVARPVVEDYIRENIGPKAVARDLLATFRVLSRFGPQLPDIVEQALDAQKNLSDSTAKSSPKRVPYVIGGSALVVGVLLGLVLSIGG